MEKSFERIEGINYELVTSNLRAPVDQKDIKEREGGNKTILRYVTGKYVIDRLIESTGNNYLFEVIDRQIIRSEPKDLKVWNQQTRKLEQVYDEAGNKKKDEQAPYIIVQGRLTIPGLGSREQFGTAELYGGVTEQAESIKGACTDCLKKCASLFGVALELYEAPASTAEEPKRNVPSYSKAVKPVVSEQKFKDEDIAALKRIKENLEIKDNSELDKYVRQFTGKEDATYRDINPSNIGGFNLFMEKR